MKNIIRVALLIASLTVVASFGVSTAATCGSTGSPTNEAGSCETGQNNLKCGDNTDAGGIDVFVAEGGNHVEVCSDDDSPLPVEGRVGGGENCQCVYADGGNSNDPPANGWARIDQSGVNCGSADEVSYNSGPGTPDECG